MHIFKNSYCQRLFKGWLLVFACQAGQLLTQLHATYDDYSEPASSPNSYQTENWQPPQGISQNELQSVLSQEDTQNYYSFEQPYYPAQTFNYDPNQPSYSSEQMAAYLAEMSENREGTSVSYQEWQKPQLQGENTSQAHGYHSSLYQNQKPSHATVISDQPVESSAGNEWQNFKTFDSSSTSSLHKTATESISSPPNISNEEKKILKPKVDPADSALDLSQGKGEVKIVKKKSEATLSIDHSQQLSEQIVGKQMIGDPTIGFVDSFEKEELAPSAPVQTFATERTPFSHLAVPMTHEADSRLIAQIQAPSTEEDNALDTNNNPSANDTQEANTPSAPSTPVIFTPSATRTDDTPPQPPRPPTIITPSTPAPANPRPVTHNPGLPSAQNLKEISINFNNVAMIEYIRFISRISNKNFIFDDEDLQFNVTIVSEEPTSVENLMAALLQELKIRDLSLIEQGNNIIIHRNLRVRAPARVVADGTEQISSRESELVTRVFRLNTLDPLKASEIIRPLLSDSALVEVLRDTNNLVITDLVTNINKIAQLIEKLDGINSGVTIGQYIVRNAFVDTLVDLANKLLQPIAQGNPFVLVPHAASNSIYIVSNSFLVEKALAIIENLDLNSGGGRTQMLSLDNLRPSNVYGLEQDRQFPTQANLPPTGNQATTVVLPSGQTITGATVIPGVPRLPSAPGLPSHPGGPILLGPDAALPESHPLPGVITEPGSAILPGTIGSTGAIDLSGVPESYPLGGISEESRLSLSSRQGPGEYPFAPGRIGAEGQVLFPSSIFDESRDFMPGGISSDSQWIRDLPTGHLERTLFFIYKLRYRRGDQIEIALRKIASALQFTGTTNADLIAVINSSQWIEASNALIFAGTSGALEKIRELILEIDVPLRQVFIEMLILDTTVRDSLSYGVDWINRFGGGSTTGEQGFVGEATNLFAVAEDTDIGVGIVPPILPLATGLLQAGTALASGYTGGVIGTHLTHNGTRFSTIGGLVKALYLDAKARILLNPKIITEDNNTAEIFVGGTDRYKTQSITNDLGTLVTNNFQFIDVGTTLRVTPLIGNNGVITLDIIQETTNASAEANVTTPNQLVVDVNLVSVLDKTRTVTRIHVPNGFFVILSGMIREDDTRSQSRIPCLGGVPILGCIGKTQDTTDRKRNMMIFIRPLIVDTEDELEDITKRQQDIFREKSKLRRAWNYEIDEGLQFLNLRPTDPDEIGCNQK